MPAERSGWRAAPLVLQASQLYAWALAIVADAPPLYTVTAALLIGDAAGNCHFHAPPGSAATVGLAAVALMLWNYRREGVLLALLALAAAATSPVYELLNPAGGARSLGRFADGSTVTVEGYLDQAPERIEEERAGLRLSLRVERAGLAGEALSPTDGHIRVSLAESFPLRIGDELRVTARLRFPRNDGNPGEFDYRGWLLRQGIDASMFVRATRSAPHPYELIGQRPFPIAVRVEAVREHIAHFIDAHLTYPENVEMRALIIGDRGGIGEQLRDDFALTGMAHLLVISGLHLGLVFATAFFCVRLLIGFGAPALMIRGYANKVAALASVIAVCAYAAIAGHRVSTIRALVMVLSYALAIALDRSRELVSSLALAALVLIIALPGSTADIGFQLSFASVLFILLGMGRFAAWWRWHYANPFAVDLPRSRLNLWAETIAGYIAVSFWAALGTAPLTAFHFNQFSLVGIVANAVVVPIMGFGSVVLGLLASAISLVSERIAAPILIGAGRLAGLGTRLAVWFRHWPLAWYRIFTPTPLELVIIYGLLLLWLTAPLAGAGILAQVGRLERSSTTSSRAGLRRWCGAALSVALAIDVAYWLQQRYLCPDLRITFLAVGEGDAAVVRFPGSRVMLIDGGGAFGGAFDPGERIVAPYLWSQKIMQVDYVLLSHPDRDHYGGLIYIVRNFRVGAFWTSGVESPDITYGVLLDALRRAPTASATCNAAHPPTAIGGVLLRCLGPLATMAELKENNSSMVVRLDYGASSILFAGDLEAKGERELIAAGANLRAAVLKVPHHGSHTSSSAAFVAAVSPALAVISLGYHNRFHFPAAEVIARYRAAHATVLRTDEDGAISVEASPTTITVTSYRNGRVALPRSVR
ncbi:MAG TPA: DNA internalization-related competence protein ComEC/Rec2 [Candidatus Binataceae bacterium]|nr:DNA internalization-related competence protein ComEC/Rec2 [Candidatus Binataceae bacterium]